MPVYIRYYSRDYTYLHLCIAMYILTPPIECVSRGYEYNFIRIVCL